MDFEEARKDKEMLDTANSILSEIHRCKKRLLEISSQIYPGISVPIAQIQSVISTLAYFIWWETNRMEGKYGKDILSKLR